MQRFTAPFLTSALFAALLCWAGCSDPGHTGIKAPDGATSMPAGAAGPPGGTESLAEGDFEMVAVEPELTRAEERGLMIFRHYCAHCHGAYGFGDGLNSFGLETPPRDLQAVELDSRTDEELQQVITDGGAAHGLSRLMPPWGQTLEPHSIADLVAMIRILPDLEVPEGDSAAPALDEAGDDMDDFSL
jgi:mono/diheme cytochrome c family protein